VFYGRSVTQCRIRHVYTDFAFAVIDFSAFSNSCAA
jgi:hypothetical protein